jgi:hypothetical protein
MHPLQDFRGMKLLAFGMKYRSWIQFVQAPLLQVHRRGAECEEILHQIATAAALGRNQIEGAADFTAAALPVMQDGGVAVDDITAHLPNEDWAVLPKEFFLS